MAHFSYWPDEVLGCSEAPWPPQTALVNAGDGIGDPEGLSCAVSHGAESLLIPMATNSCSLLPCSLIHHCLAYQGTTTPQLRQPGKAKATGVRMKNLSIQDVQLEIHIPHSEWVLGLMQSDLTVVRAWRMLDHLAWLSWYPLLDWVAWGWACELPRRDLWMVSKLATSTPSSPKLTSLYVSLSCF